LFLPLTDHSLLAWRFGVRVREGDPGTRGPRGVLLNSLSGSGPLRPARALRTHYARMDGP
jgi:hypothetical protein